jgi:hypothetical protein
MLAGHVSHTLAFRQPHGKNATAKRLGPADWPPFLPTEIFLWGYLKARVCVINAASIINSKEQIWMHI